MCSHRSSQVVNKLLQKPQLLSDLCFGSISGFLGWYQVITRSVGANVYLGTEGFGRDITGENLKLIIGSGGSQ